MNIFGRLVQRRLNQGGYTNSGVKEYQFYTLLVPGVPAGEGGLDQMTSKGSLQPQPISNSIITVFLRMEHDAN